MGFLDKLLHRSPAESQAATVEESGCNHWSLVAQWDSPADMGQEDRATSYRCANCDEVFSPQEAGELRAQAADRLRDLSEPPSPN